MVVEPSRKSSSSVQSRPERRMGRPSKLTPQFVKIVSDAVAAGMSLTAAAMLGGVHRTRLATYTGRGRVAAEAHERRVAELLEQNPAMANTVEDLGELDTAEDPEERKFRDLHDAIARAGVLARGVAEASVFSTDKLAWLRYSPSARMNGERPWGRQDQVELADPGGRPLGSNAVEQLAARIELIAERKAALAEGVVEGNGDVT